MCILPAVANKLLNSTVAASGGRAGLRLKSSQSSRHLFRALRFVPVCFCYRAAQDCWPVWAGALRLVHPAHNIARSTFDQRATFDISRRLSAVVQRGNARLLEWSGDGAIVSSRLLSKICVICLLHKINNLFLLKEPI